MIKRGKLLDDRDYAPSTRKKNLVYQNGNFGGKTDTTVLSIMQTSKRMSTQHHNEAEKLTSKSIERTWYKDISGGGVSLWNNYEIWQIPILMQKDPSDNGQSIYE